MKRLLTIFSIILPITILLGAYIWPESDPTYTIPMLHFYIVSFFTFAAVVVALLIGYTLGEETQPRHRLLVTAFAAMGGIFFVHGITTPGALMLTANPGIRWAAWLTLFIGGLLFALASFDHPDHPLATRQVQVINTFLAVFYALFVITVFFAPQILSTIDSIANPIHAQLVFWMTMVVWGYAAVRFWQIWRQTQDGLDGVMALVSVWFVLATISLHQFPVWHLSWWLYHILLLMSAFTAMFALTRAYEQLRRFSLIRYYMALGLIVTAVLTLLSAYILSTIVAQDLLSASNMEEAVVQARLFGLLITGGSMATLFVALYFVVRRAEQLISANTAELAQAYANLQASESLRADLNDMVVHDLRSPLTAIKLNIDLLADNLEDPTKKPFRDRFISNAQSSVQRMLSLINQLLDVAKLEEGKLQLQREPLSMADFITEQVTPFIIEAETDKIALQINVPDDLPTIMVDADLLGRVLGNLIGNALKYTPQGGAITIHAHQQANNLQIEVIDTGEGIPPDKLNSIFDKFMQITDDNGRPLRKGTGLGLPFCKLAIEAHNGRIWAESEPDKGSTFAFTLPLN